MKKRQKTTFFLGWQEQLAMLGAVRALFCHVHRFKTKKGSEVHYHFSLHDSNLDAKTENNFPMKCMTE
uniref:hypothetical protein n=1 Tax=Bacillus cytotoxicus TaxID=580165 RepID=UPI0020414587